MNCQLKTVTLLLTGLCRVSHSTNCAFVGLLRNFIKFNVNIIQSLKGQVTLPSDLRPIAKIWLSWFGNCPQGRMTEGKCISFINLIITQFSDILIFKLVPWPLGRLDCREFLTAIHTCSGRTSGRFKRHAICLSIDTNPAALEECNGEHQTNNVHGNTPEWSHGDDQTTIERSKRPFESVSVPNV